MNYVNFLILKLQEKHALCHADEYRHLSPATVKSLQSIQSTSVLVEASSFHPPWMYQDSIPECSSSHKLAVVSLGSKCPGKHFFHSIFNARIQLIDRSTLDVWEEDQSHDDVFPPVAARCDNVNTVEALAASSSTAADIDNNIVAMLMVSRRNQRCHKLLRWLHRGIQDLLWAFSPIYAASLAI